MGEAGKSRPEDAPGAAISGERKGQHGGEQRRGGRFSRLRKEEAILRLIRGEDLETLSRELGVTAATLSQWRGKYTAGGQTALLERERDARDEETERLKAKIGELTMANELLREKIHHMEANRPLAWRRSRP
jgi:transposase-like protein